MVLCYRFDFSLEGKLHNNSTHQWMDAVLNCSYRTLKLTVLLTG